MKSEAESGQDSKAQNIRAKQQHDAPPGQSHSGPRIQSEAHHEAGHTHVDRSPKGIFGWILAIFHLEPHAHEHGMQGSLLETSARGLWAIKVSFVGLMLTAALQAVIVYFSGSVALLADTIHNFGDALTAVPMWMAFKLVRRGSTRRFTYGFGRAEDLAGLAIVLLIVFSAAVAGYESIDRILHPREITYLGWVAAAALIGFIGNEAVAIFRIRIGREIGSTALVADGFHARTDGLTSLAVLIGALGAWLGFPLADPIIGLLITVAILRIAWKAARSMWLRIMDAVEPGVVDTIEFVSRSVPKIEGVHDIRCRWIGHQLHAELHIEVASSLSVIEGHELAENVRHELFHVLPRLARITVHVDPSDPDREKYHTQTQHHRDEVDSEALANHSHPHQHSSVV